MAKRIFVYDGRDFPDPDPKMTIEEVRQNLANLMPELANAETIQSKRKVAETKVNGVVVPAHEDDVIEFRKRVGVKG